MIGADLLIAYLLGFATCAAIAIGPRLVGIYERWEEARTRRRWERAIAALERAGKERRN